MKNKHKYSNTIDNISTEINPYDSSITTIFLRRGKSESLKRFHPWVFSGAIAGANGKLNEGDIVRIVSNEGELMGYGHYQIGSIAVRMLTFNEEAIDQKFWQTRLSEAFRLRSALKLTNRADNNIYRLVHGEGDRLPGLVIDVYGKTAVMQAHSVGMHVCRETIADALIAASEGLIENVYYKSETTLPFKADLHQENGFLRGNENGNIAIENGLQFHIDWLRGQKTGFFVDQRENRSLLEFYAKGRNVLNMFCYTGGFSVYAMRGGANLVHSVDSSAKAGSNYDLIVLDPPAFAKHKDALPRALKGYTRLNAIAFKKIKPGGIIFTFSCSQAVNKDQFRLAVFTAAAQSGRHVRILHQLHQPADHPINIYHPEGEYLKGLVVEVE